MPEFVHDDLAFHYQDVGSGLPLVFQHGLGGDVGQPCGLFSPPEGVRLIAFDCRAHGKTEPLGPHQKIGISQFADDLAALLDYLEIDTAIVGGISMGAAVAVNFALRRPERVRGLIQSRPAWWDGPNLRNAKFFTMVAKMLRIHGTEVGQQFFRDSEMYQQLQTESPDVAESLAGQFDNFKAVERSVRLERIPLDAPYNELQDLAKIRVPTLVMANRIDPIHPFEFGQRLAQSIPEAEFQELTPKSESVQRHGEDVQRMLTDFLHRTF